MIITSTIPVPPFMYLLIYPAMSYKHGIHTPLPINPGTYTVYPQQQQL